MPVYSGGNEFLGFLSVGVEGKWEVIPAGRSSLLRRIGTFRINIPAQQSV